MCRRTRATRSGETPPRYGLDLLVRVGALDDDLAEVLVEQVPHDPDDQVGLGREQRRRAALGGLGLDVVPLRLQPLDVAGQVVLGRALGRGPHDHAGAVGTRFLSTSRSRRRSTSESLREMPEAWPFGT